MIENLDRFYFFGDSLSDTGTVLDLTGGEFPTFPYATGRFSSGNIWVDYLAEDLDLTIDTFTGNSFVNDGVNFAIGGATSSSEGSLDLGLTQQIVAFNELVEVQKLQNPEEVLEDDAFFLWIGSNDYFRLIQDDPNTPDTIETNFPETRRELRQKVVEVVDVNIRGAIENIIEQGGEEILVFNLPDLQKTPLGRSLEREDRVALRKLKNIHNRRLDSLIEDIEVANPDVNLIEVDTNELLDEVLANPEEFGFTDKKNNFTGIDLYTGITQPPAEGDVNDFLYIDSVHVTTGAHRLVADLVIGELTDEGLI